MLYLAFFHVYAYIACPHKHSGCFIIINSKLNISPFLIGPNPPTNSSPGAYHNYLKNVAKISIDSIQWYTVPMYNQTSFPGSGAVAKLFWHE